MMVEWTVSESETHGEYSLGRRGNRMGNCFTMEVGVPFPNVCIFMVVVGGFPYGDLSSDRDAVTRVLK